jgi:hypothetical protein
VQWDAPFVAASKRFLRFGVHDVHRFASQS